ncbi:acyltransferase family protein [Sediminibacillus massiliensis]|uniref:acyltransferase family protein n=1 Tax=Sediminibacillus massiliensis TaxID=1926277 RepID=UPI000988411B|nr:acyltransferase family protein [Sediminibacillus massiliensis]
MQRESFFDNAKFFLIFLVVFGHLIQPVVNDSQTMNTLYHWVYLFHMPAFIFLAGFFAKGSGSKDYIAKLAKKLLYPYMVFQVVYTAYYFLIGKSSWMNGPFTPHWSLWFLFSLFSWHLLLALFKKMPPALGIGTAIGLGLVVGYFEPIGQTFSLSRTFVFFPYFLMGYWVTKDQLFLVKSKAVKIASILIMAAAATIIAVYPEFSTGWLLGSKSYETLGMPVMGSLARMSVYFAAVLMSISILAWIPKREGLLTSLGQRTLYIYLLHGFIIQFIRQQDWLFYNHPIDIIGYAAISLGIVTLLASKVMLGLWQPFIEGKTSILKKAIFSRKDKGLR